jgi:hypothetical protein
VIISKRDLSAEWKDLESAAAGLGLGLDSDYQYIILNVH